MDITRFVSGLRWTAALALLLVAGAAQAARVQVQVVLPNGELAGLGVQVEIFDAGPNRVFGDLQLTNAQSRVRFDDVPNGPKVILAQQAGAYGQETLVVNKNNHNVKVTLDQGVVATPPPTPSPTPTPTATPTPSPTPTPTATPTPSPTPTPTATPASFATQLELEFGNAATTKDVVRLAFRVPAGAEPIEYLASESESFLRTLWRPYPGPVEFNLSDSVGTKTVYGQLRVRMNGEILTSERVSDTIQRNAEIIAVAVGTVPPSVDYVFTLNGTRDPRTALTYAREQGFGFESRRITSNVSVGGGSFATGSCAFDTPMPMTARSTKVKDLFGEKYLAHTCEYTLLSGRQLNAGWSFRGAKVIDTSGLLSSLVIPLAPVAPPTFSNRVHLRELAVVGGRDAWVKLRIERPEAAAVLGDSETTGTVSELTLRGPEGADWRNAFKR